MGHIKFMIFTQDEWDDISHSLYADIRDADLVLVEDSNGTTYTIKKNRYKKNNVVLDSISDFHEEIRKWMEQT